MPVILPPPTAHDSQTPSPQAVNEFSSDTSKSSFRCDVVSDLISDQLVSQYVRVDAGMPSLNGTDDEQDDERNVKDEVRDREESSAEVQDGKDAFAKDYTPSHTTNEHASSAETDACHTSQSEQADPWSTSPSITPTPTNTPTKSNIILGPERQIIFHTESLGIKLSRHTDGFIRILSISPYRSTNNDKIRDGLIQEGDLVRQVCDVDLRHPIDGGVWKLIVGLIKMTPRPFTMLVCTEYEEVEDIKEATATYEEGVENVRSMCGRCEVTGQTICPSSPSIQQDRVFNEKRQIIFYEESLGVKLQHTAQGYVVVHSVTSMEDDATNPSRKGILKPNDVVLEVGGVWDLYNPISINAWSILVKFIKECRRPMRMVVTDCEYLNSINVGSSSPGSEESLQSIVEDEMSQIVEEEEHESLSLCALEDSMGVIDEEDEYKLTLPAEDESSIEHRNTS